MAIPRNPYLNVIAPDDNWMMTGGSMTGSTTPNQYGGSFQDWARQYFDPNFQQQFFYGDEAGGLANRNALPGLADLAQAGYFNQFNLSRPESDWLGQAVAQEQNMRSGREIGGGLSLDDLQMLGVVSGPFLSGAASSFGQAAPAMPAAVPATASQLGGMMPAAVPASASQLGAIGGMGGMMPAAVPAMDPTFGGALQQTAPGVYSSAAAAPLPAMDLNALPPTNAGPQQPQMSPSEMGFENFGPQLSPSEIGPESFFNGQGPSQISNTGGMGPSSGTSNFGGGASGGGSTQSGGFGINDVAYGLMGLGGILQMSQAEDFEDQMNQQMQQMQADQPPAYPFEQNWDLVNQYLRDPMSVLRNNPGYLASVDFLEKEGKRKMAAGGYNASGNRDHYLADVLGKNANTWFTSAWQPIKDAAGLSQQMNPAQMGQVQSNAQNSIFQAKQNALGDMWNAGTNALPSIFKFALG